MINKDYNPPKFLEKSFRCPHCGVVAMQEWIYNDVIRTDIIGDEFYNFLEEHPSAQCANCKKFSLWANGKMVYPLVPISPPPNEDMPETVKKIYEEARQVQPFSARASAALLRVTLEKLTEHLGETEGYLYDRIVNLREKKVLSDRAVRIAHIIRKYGNKGGAHAGTIDLEDDENTVNQLFMYINIIVDETISQPKNMTLLEEVIEDKKEEKKNRDSDN